MRETRSQVRNTSCNSVLFGDLGVLTGDSWIRLKDENEHLLRQLNDRTQQYESDKAALLLDHQRRLDDLQRDRTNELENLRTLQRFVFAKCSISSSVAFDVFRQTVDHLRREHEQTIQRLKQLKQEEISTALDVTTHTRWVIHQRDERKGLFLLSLLFF